MDPLAPGATIVYSNAPAGTFAPSNPDWDYGYEETTTVTASGNQIVDGQLFRGKWATTDLTFSFPDSPDDFPAFTDHGKNWQQNRVPEQTLMTELEKEYGRYWYEQFDLVSGLTFTELTGEQDREAVLKFTTATVWAGTGTVPIEFRPENKADEARQGDVWMGQDFFAEGMFLGNLGQ